MSSTHTFVRAALLPLAVLATLLALPARSGEPPIVPVHHSDAEWRKLLAPESYRVLRQAGTEIAFTGKLLNEHRKGTFRCAGCGLELFRSDAKFDSGTGWPSFWKPGFSDHVVQSGNAANGMYGIEVHCARCGGHLGHVFDDGPRPTGLRYCINSAALEFVPAR